MKRSALSVVRSWQALPPMRTIDFDHGGVTTDSEAYAALRDAQGRIVRAPARPSIKAATARVSSSRGSTAMPCSPTASTMRLEMRFARAPGIRDHHCGNPVGPRTSRSGSDAHNAIFRGDFA